MKTTKTFFSVLFALSLSTAACAVDQTMDTTSDTEATTYSKVLTLTNGDNQVLLTLGSKNQAALDAISTDDYNLTPIFERPEEVADAQLGSSEMPAKPLQTSLSDVTIESQVIQLEEGAIGYSLEKIAAQELVAVTPMGCPHDTHISTKDFVTIRKFGSVCTTAKISISIAGFWFQVEYSDSFCPGDVMSSTSKYVSDSIKAKVCSGMAYSVDFY